MFAWVVSVDIECTYPSPAATLLLFVAGIVVMGPMKLRVTGGHGPFQKLIIESHNYSSFTEAKQIEVSWVMTVMMNSPSLNICKYGLKTQYDVLSIHDSLKKSHKVCGGKKL